MNLSLYIYGINLLYTYAYMKYNCTKYRHEQERQVPQPLSLLQSDRQRYEFEHLERKFVTFSHC